MSRVGETRDAERILEQKLLMEKKGFAEQLSEPFRPRDIDYGGC